MNFLSKRNVLLLPKSLKQTASFSSVCDVLFQPNVLFGSIIAMRNILNIDKDLRRMGSPLVPFSCIKGAMYGAAFPASSFFMLFSKKLEHHEIPASVYWKELNVWYTLAEQKKNEEKDLKEKSKQK